MFADILPKSVQGKDLCQIIRNAAVQREYTFENDSDGVYLLRALPMQTSGKLNSSLNEGPIYLKIRFYCFEDDKPYRSLLSTTYVGNKIMAPTTFSRQDRIYKQYYDMVIYNILVHVKQAAP